MKIFCVLVKYFPILYSDSCYKYYIYIIFISIFVLFLPVLDELDCGGCLLKNEKTSIFECINSGGDGNFQFLLPLNRNFHVKEHDQDVSKPQ